jgi:isocitrate dehydrogenase (NAD+)
MVFSGSASERERVAARPTVVVMGGDGMGPVVVAQARRVLDAVGFDADYVDAEIGWSCWKRDGDPLPARTIELLERHRLGLLGAVTSKPKREAEDELPEALRGRGLEYRSPLLALRQRFGLATCIRPARTLPGNPTNTVRRAADGAIEEPRIDIVVFRENTQGVYAGVEWIDPPAPVRAALAAHPRFAPYRDVPGRDLAIAVRIVTREACRRILEAAFRYAAEHGYRTITLAEKPNVLRDTSGLFEEVAREVRGGHPGITLRSVNIDALALELTRRPEEFDVVVASNLFGDIVSDAAAGLTGGLGFAASANLGNDVAIFEPVHGTAPRHAGIDPPILNPCAAILAAAMLLDHAGEARRGQRVRDAVAAVVGEGRVRTYDMLRLPPGRDAVRLGAAPTSAMTDAILARLVT